MRKPSVKQRKSMERALRAFEANVDLALPYLAGRGIIPKTAARYRLGVVYSDAPLAYQKYLGRLAIPYFDKLGVSAFKFRCIEHVDCKQKNCKKYLNPSGQEAEIFRAIDCEDYESDTLHLCEGEMDKITLSQYTTQPTLATPGADAWEDRWACHLNGFERVICWQHGDIAGQKWARRMREASRVAEVIECPPGEDVSSLIQSWGPEKVLALANGGEEDE